MYTDSEPEGPEMALEPKEKKKRKKRKGEREKKRLKNSGQ